MCMKAKTPDIKQPAPSPTPVAQTDDMAQKEMNNGSQTRSARKLVMIVQSWLAL